MEEELQMTFYKHINRHTISSVLRTMQIKTTMGCHFTPNKLEKIKKSANTNYW